MFNPSRPQEIGGWTASDLHRLPDAESDQFEYKSSSTAAADLADKLARAASAFWNTGGGVFVAGVDNKGQPDGGIPCLIGKQTLRDWVDQALGTVTPAGPYGVTLIDRGDEDFDLRDDSAVLLVAFGTSHQAPHMAPDRRYYVRAGAHTVPASHFLVETIRASRGLQQPWLECLLRHAPVQGGAAVQLLVVAINEAPALDVRIQAEPIDGRTAGYSAGSFPKRVPLIDRQNPFLLNLNSASALHDAAFLVHLHFLDMKGREHSATCVIDTREQLGPVMV